MAPETIKSLSYSTAISILVAVVTSSVWLGVAYATQTSQGTRIDRLEQAERDRAADSKQIAITAADVDWIKKALEKRGITP